MYIILTIYFCTALDLLQTAIEKAGFTEKVVIGMDVAASEFHHEGKYDLDFKSPPDSQRHISAEELADIYQSFVNNYPGRHGFGTLNVISQLKSTSFMKHFITAKYAKVLYMNKNTNKTNKLTIKDNKSQKQ